MLKRLIRHIKRWNKWRKHCGNGRLGDLDALYAEISNGNKAYNGIEGYDGEYPNIANVDDCLEAIKYAETVIEPEGRE